jgi:hypothetical protein
MQKYISTGISMPTELFEKVEQRRGDVSRSKFLLRILEQSFLSKEERKNVGPTQEGEEPTTSADYGVTRGVTGIV